MDRSRFLWMRYAVLLLLAIASFPAPANGPTGLSVCNKSTTTPMYLAQASQFNWGRNYETAGWTEIPPAFGKGSLGMRCTYLEGLSSDAIQFAIAHRDAKGQMALYAYEFPLGSGILAGESWFCVRLDRSFRFQARGFEELSECEQGAIRVRFYHYIEFNDEDEMLISFEPDPRNDHHKIATFAEMAKGRFGALAVHPQTRAYGYSHEHMGSREAAAAALAQCKSPACQIVNVVQASCLAIAFGRPSGYKVAAAPTQEAALASAAFECKRTFDGCQAPVPAGCSSSD